jgi:cell division protein FtsB
VTARKPDVRRGSRRVTSRAVILALVVTAVAITVAGPLREYVRQRGQLAQLHEQVEQAGARVDQLKAQHERWSDPSYVEQQARERLHYVMPGETGEIPLAGAQATPGHGSSAKPEPSGPWYSDLWSTVVTAGNGAPATPVP